MTPADTLTVPLDRPIGDARFELELPWPLAGDQERASAQLLERMRRGAKHQVLLGVTGSGKTVTMAKVIAEARRPALVLAHNKTLAAQLYGEFKEFFPKNAVHYFVSYYDYYQPEAYIPRSDTYIEKDSSRNEEIDKMRHAATRTLFERRDVVIVASVSCIYGLGAPIDYGAVTVRLLKGQRRRRDTVLRHLVDIQYERNDLNFVRGTFRVRGDTLEIHPAYDETIVRVEMFGDTIESITVVDPVTGERLHALTELVVFPATHYVAGEERMKKAIVRIEAEL
ncbi:MAG: DEAD/DEAH box helicase family protein, partial [Chloroflexota bacterium]